MIWVDVAASQRGGVVTSTSKGLEKSSQGHVGNDGRCFFFFFLGSLFNWAVLFMAFPLGGVPKKKGGAGVGCFLFLFFGNGKLKFCKLGTL